MAAFAKHIDELCSCYRDIVKENQALKLRIAQLEKQLKEAKEETDGIREAWRSDQRALRRYETSASSTATDTKKNDAGLPPVSSASPTITPRSAVSDADLETILFEQLGLRRPSSFSPLRPAPAQTDTASATPSSSSANPKKERDAEDAERIMRVLLSGCPVQ
jgi:cell division septum initiation protein DivIVA